MEEREPWIARRLYISYSVCEVALQSALESLTPWVLGPSSPAKLEKNQ